MLMKKLAAGAATTAIALSIGAIAHAQSTATQIQEVVVTGSRTPANTGGLAVQVKEAKDQSIVTQQFFATQPGSKNFAQLINLLPGVSYSSEDYTGILSGDLRIHGFDGAHISVTIDGSPLNDTGNYAIYPGEYLVSELTDHITVNTGATDVDSPSASAVGGTINIVSKLPSKDFGAVGVASGGSYNFQHYFAEIDSGAIGPWGTTSYIAANYSKADKFRGAGDLERKGIDGRIYQPLSGSDFISLAGTYVQERPIFYYSASRSNLAQYGPNYDYNTGWVAPTAINGHADTVPNGVGDAGSDTNYFALHPNPVDFATIRGTSKFTLGRGLIFTFDPSFFYTLANGGGATGISECDVRLQGATRRVTTVGSTTTAVAGSCVDLNGDGDTKDTVALYTPSNTNTYRYLLSSSLVYELNANNRFQLAYTGDYGRHRQTSEYTTINQANGIPNDVFGARPGYGTPVITADGLLLRGRDRFSEAILNQVAASYVGKFFDDRLHINLGVRLPYFQRNLNQYCDSYNGSSVYCSGISQASLQAAYNADLALNKPLGSTATNLTAALGNATVTTGANGVPNFRLPFKATYKFDKALPNVGISYDLGGHSSVYVTYAQGFSAPKTDDLYLSGTDLVQPETSTNYGAGYRYQTRTITASANVFQTEYHNRIVQSYDPNDPTLSVDRNVGNVQIRGIDLEGGIKPIEHWNIYASATFLDSELKSNYFLSTGGIPFALPTQGKQLVMTPQREFSVRTTYDLGPITLGAQGKYISSRYVSDINDDRIPGYALFDVDARYNMDFIGKKTYLQLNIQNLFNRFYISRASTVGNAYNYLIPGRNVIYTPSTPFFYVGAPSSFTLSIHSEF